MASGTPEKIGESWQRLVAAPLLDNLLQYTHRLPENLRTVAQENLHDDHALVVSRTLWTHPDFTGPELVISQTQGWLQMVLPTVSFFFDEGPTRYVVMRLGARGGALIESFWRVGLQEGWLQACDQHDPAQAPSMELVPFAQRVATQDFCGKCHNIFVVANPTGE